MSKAQGDGYRTWTNVELNKYRARLDARLDKLIDDQKHWYKVNGFLIYTEQENIVDNPRGSWKWDGWVITGRRYRIDVFQEQDITFENGRARINAPALAWFNTEDKDEANAKFQTYLSQLRDHNEKLEKIA